MTFFGNILQSLTYQNFDMYQEEDLFPIHMEYRGGSGHTMQALLSSAFLINLSQPCNFTQGTKLEKIEKIELGLAYHGQLFFAYISLVDMLFECV